MKRLDKIRKRQVSKSTPQKLAVTFLALLLGFGMGMLAQHLAAFPPGSTAWLGLWDPHPEMLFRSLLPWAFTGLIFALFSKTPLRAAVNVLALYGGTLLGCLLYSGVFLHASLPWSCLSGWLILTAVSPVLAAVSWYGRGVGTAAGFIAAFILAYYFLQAFVFTRNFYGFGLRGELGLVPLAMLAAAIGMLWRKPLQILFSTIGGFLLAYIYILLPFHIPYI